MTKEEILKAFEAWGLRDSLFYKNFAIPFFTTTPEGQKILDMLESQHFPSARDLKLFMMNNIGVK